MDLVVIAAGMAAGAHQCLFPEDHLDRFFLSGDAAAGKGDKRIAVEVMRWLGFSNICMTALFGAMYFDYKLNSKMVIGGLGTLCLFDVVAVKVPFYKSVVVNKSIPRFVGSALLVVGSTLLCFSFSHRSGFDRSEFL